MLMMTSLSSEGSAGYAEYLTAKQSTEAIGDYYLERNGEIVEAPGVWVGSAGALKQAGVVPTAERVEQRELVALMGGVNAKTGGDLRRVGANGGRSPGVDLCFSLPKSATLVREFGSAEHRELIDRVFAETIQATLDYAAKTVPLCERRERGRLIREHATELVGAKFVHSTSRAVGEGVLPDPHLHAHVLITHVVRADGKAAAVRHRALASARTELQAYFEASMAARMREAGYDLRVQLKDGAKIPGWELAAIPEAAVQAASKRHEQIKAIEQEFFVAKGRQPTPGEIRVIAYESRESKSAVADTDDMKETVRSQILNEADLTLEDLSPVRHEQAGRLLQGRGADRTVVDRLPEKSSFSEHAVRKAVLEDSLFEGVGPVDHLAKSSVWKGLHKVASSTSRTDARYARSAHVALEAKVQQLAYELAHSDHPEVDPSLVALAHFEIDRDRGFGLSQEQKAAVDLCCREGQLAMIVGQAGTGKSVTLDAIARAHRAADYQVLGVAVAGRTADQLVRDSAAIKEGFSVEALLAGVKSGSINVDRRTLLVFDEAAVAEPKRLDGVLTLASETNARIIVVGDDRQLSPVGEGGIWERLENVKGVPVASISEIRRTRDPEEQQVWQQVRRGEIKPMVDHYQRLGRFHLKETREEAMEAAIQGWRADIRTGKESAVITNTRNIDRDLLIARQQQILREDGHLTGKHITAQTKPWSLHQGEAVQTIGALRSDDGRKIKNGELGEVSAVNLKSRGVKLTFEDGRECSVRLDEVGESQVVPLPAGHIFKSQGRTFDTCHVLTGGPQTRREDLYVAITRARSGTHVYGAELDLDPNPKTSKSTSDLRQVFEERAARIGNEQAALTVAEQTGRQFGASEIRTRSTAPSKAILDRLSELGLRDASQSISRRVATQE